MLSWKNLTWDIRKQASGYLMFLKRNRSGKMKGRGCADGRPQREYVTKEESSSPTVSLYALMGSCLMDAIDGRKVITVDIPGVFLQGETENTGLVHEYLVITIDYSIAGKVVFTMFDYLEDVIVEAADYVPQEQLFVLSWE